MILCTHSFVLWNIFQAFRPFILTRDKIQAKVVGVGYPSLPTYTVDDFYEWRYKEELEKMKGQKNATPASLWV